MNTLKYDQAEAYRKGKQFAQAVPLFAELWDTAPSKQIGWRYAETLRKMKRLDEAEKIALEAITRFPNDTFAAKQLAWTLQDQERYSEAADLFAELQPDDYTTGSYITCLRKIGQLDEAEGVAQSAIDRKPNDAYLKTQLGWVLYDQRLKPAKEDSDLDAVISAANEIMELHPDELLVRKTVLTVIKVAKDQNNVRWRIVLDWANKATPQAFDTTEKEYNSRKIMSDREIYYIGRSRALFELKQYPQALTQVGQGLEDFPRSFFLARLEALSQAQLGDVQGAIEKMRELQKHPRSTWYAQAELAAMEYQLGRTEEAYHLMRSALNRTKQGPEFLLTHLITLAEIAHTFAQWREAATYVRLARIIRTNRDWTVPASLTQLEMNINDTLDEQGVSVTDLPEDEHKLTQICHGYWRGNSTDVLGRKQGVIIFPRDENVSYRFIKPADGSDQIFVHKRNLPRNCSAGVIVDFALKPSFDQKRKCPSVEAIDVRIIKS